MKVANPYRFKETSKGQLDVIELMSHEDTAGKEGQMKVEIDLLDGVVYEGFVAISHVSVIDNTQEFVFENRILTISLTVQGEKTKASLTFKTKK